MTSFRASARTVDMLGRQQIAGIPTAISELFKNAHDAYADRVEVDFFRWNQLFVLRDDGIGMTRDDFQERWLTLGTESKVGSTSLRPPGAIPGKRKRPLLGEKGIGRLAIAVIGPQVLVMTRAHDPADSPLVCAFVSWTLFESPGLRLDEIDVPIVDLPPGELPDASAVQGLLDHSHSNVKELGETIGAGRRRQIERELRQFEALDPGILDAALEGPSLRDSHGMQFLILPVDESLQANLEQPRDRFGASAMRKALVGFTNTMSPGGGPIIESAFRDHKTRDAYDEIIGEGQFFSPEEFAEADHHVEGEFDEYGQFVGKVTVYGREAASHVVPWERATGRRTDCGPFAIHVAVVQGERTASRVPPEEWARLVAKLDQIGGLYVYRNGIRVLPYGGPDYDWVGIELRRTKSASYYYFSYRRIFGHVDIDSRRNAGLNEKAGREGFRENRAYRQFRDILSNFFVQVAADFFREGGVEAEAFHEVRDELERAEAIRRRREQQARARRTQFETSLADSSDAIASGEVSEAVDEILAALRKDLAAAAALRDPGEAATSFIETEARARAELAALRERFRVPAPRGFGLTRALRRDWQAYQAAWAEVELGTIEPGFEAIEKIVGSETAAHRIAVDRRRRFEEALRRTFEEARKTTRTSAGDARAALEEVQGRVSDLRRESLADVEGAIAEIQADLARLDVTQLSDDAFVAARSALEERVLNVAEAERASLDSVVEQLRTVTVGSDGDGGVSPLELAGALEDELLVLREQADEELELAQLGMALSVITHEFDVSIRAVRANLRRLRSWADVNAGIRDLYESLRTSFDHLDGYLTLFTPLQRRLYRKQVEIAGAEIETFLRDLFGDRMARHDVKLEVSRGFRRHRFVGYPSTFYPVFVNLVDNSLYWVSEAPEPRVLRLDVEDGRMLVSDSGPGIPDRDREAVFERGFTRKPGGRGLGLYISRDVLRREGYDLEIVAGADGDGATFEIVESPSRDGNEEAE
jgi:signal transduction histidine kinase